MIGLSSATSESGVGVPRGSQRAEEDLILLAIGRLVFFEGGRWLVAVQGVLWLATTVYVTINILGAIFEREAVDVETLQAALCVYILLGLFWVFLDLLIALTIPDAFRFSGGVMVRWDDPSRRAEFMRLLVFSYSTLTSTGFGDLVPASGFASTCASLEAFSAAQVCLAVVVARLVGFQTSLGSPGRPGTTGDGVDILPGRSS